MTRSYDEAEDLVQRTFARAWLYRDRYNPSKSSFYGWCLMQMRHLCSDDHRHPKPKVVSYDETNAGHTFYTVDLSLVSVQQFLDSLSENERSIVQDILDGYFISEIARRRSVSQYSIRVLLESLRPLAERIL